MVEKLAAGPKRRGRPRKKRKGRPPGGAAVTPSSSGRRQHPPSPSLVPASRRSLRQRRPRRAEDYARYDEADEDDDGYYLGELPAEEEEEEEEADGKDVEEDEDAEWERRGKKFRLLQKLPNHKHQRIPDHGGSAGSPSCSSSSDDDGGGQKPLRKRNASGHGSGGDRRGEGRPGGSEREGEDGSRHAAPPGCSGTASERRDRHCPISTPLPDKKMLEKVLDKLQKKDTYGVFVEPVDPEELPDYHDIIAHPMDFGTIRKKLSTGSYANFEEFESDVFLVCTNAMEYNAPDTIYFRQARSIQELARKKFQIIRFDREDALKSEQNVQSNSVSKRPIKSSLCKGAQDPAGPGSHVSSASILASTGNACTGSNAVQAVPLEQPVIVEGFADGSFCENKSERGEESPATNSPVKLGRKPTMLDDDRRMTYNVSNEQADIQSDSLFATFENEPKHLVAVGLDAEYSYARSLAWFAGPLGPIAWRIASEKIEKALPTGVKFGPGWVGEYEPLLTPVLSFESQSQQSSHHPHFKHKAENWKDKTMDGEQKGTETVSAETVRSYLRVPSDSSTMRVTDGKANHMKELPVHNEPLKQKPHLVRFNPGSQPIISSSTFLQNNSLIVTSAKDCSNTRVGTNIMDKTILHNSSSMMSKVVDLSVHGPEQCPEITASGLDVISGSKGNNVQSGHSKQLELMAYRPESYSSCMDTKGMSNGKDIGTLASNSKPSPSLGFIPTDQIRRGSDCFNHGEHAQEVDDPVEVMRTMSGRIPNKISSSELWVTDNQKLVTPTVPSPRHNSSAAATAAAQAWMSVGRSSEHKSIEASKLLKMEAGAAAFGKSSSESRARSSRINEDCKNRVMPSMSQLPSKAASEEIQLQNKHMATFPQFILTELTRFHGQAPWRGLVPHVQHKQRKDVCPPDLNISFHSPGSPVLQSGILVDSQQPDLALQL